MIEDTIYEGGQADADGFKMVGWGGGGGEERAAEWETEDEENEKYG
jgi:hypothetical protein